MGAWEVNRRCHIDQQEGKEKKVETCPSAVQGVTVMVREMKCKERLGSCRLYWLLIHPQGWPSAGAAGCAAAELCRHVSPADLAASSSGIYQESERRSVPDATCPAWGTAGDRAGCFDLDFVHPGIWGTPNPVSAACSKWISLRLNFEGNCDSNSA